MTTIIAAGYVVYNAEAIWGTGATADEAWEDFRSEMGRAGISVLTADQDGGEQLGSWTREKDYTIRPATDGLLAEVEARGGGDVAWDVVSGVACTIQEAYEVAAR